MIKVKIKDKIASLVDPTDIIVCNNSDYQIEFEFDEEWDAFDSKTARFVWANQYSEVLFQGNTVFVPQIDRECTVSVGVFATNSDGESYTLHTTRPVKIDAVKSILTGSPTSPHPDPPEDVYEQLLGLYNYLSSTKVDKMIGKGLSTNDYTDEDKQKLSGIDELLDGKVDISQGASHAGKFLVVGANGNVTLLTLQTWSGGDY